MYFTTNLRTIHNIKWLHIAYQYIYNAKTNPNSEMESINAHKITKLQYNALAELMPYRANHFPPLVNLAIIQRLNSFMSIKIFKKTLTLYYL